GPQGFGPPPPPVPSPPQPAFGPPQPAFAPPGDGGFGPPPGFGPPGLGPPAPKPGYPPPPGQPGASPPAPPPFGPPPPSPTASSARCVQGHMIPPGGSFCLEGGHPMAPDGKIDQFGPTGYGGPGAPSSAMAVGPSKMQEVGGRRPLAGFLVSYQDDAL